MIGEGSVINNRFRLDRLLGRGGFAQVFLCTDLVLGRLVAIKILSPSIGDHEGFDFFGRFQAEARAVAALEHPNILGVYDYGEIDGTIYLVMPYIDGGTLHDRIPAGQLLPLNAVADYLRQTAAGLDYAHRRGIVHRDIKPQNLLVRSEDNRLLIADFGVAKVLQEGSHQTQTAAIGTVAYMAPEQFEGRVSPAIDIYALGCVLFQLLTGRVPYGGPATQAMYSHFSAPIPSVQERTSGRLPMSFQPLIDRALAKRPEARFATAGELASAFDALLTRVPNAGEGAPTIVGPPGTVPGGTSRPVSGPTPPPSLPLPPQSQPRPQLAPTAYTPTPAYVPSPQGAAPPPATARRRNWLLFGGIGVLAIVAILVGAALINSLLPRDSATPTATVRTIATAGPTGTATLGTGAQVSAPPSVAPTATSTVAVAVPSASTAAPSPSTAPPSARPSASPSASVTARATATATTGPTPTPLAIEAGPILRGHTQDVRAVAWLGERDRIITGGSDGAVILWLTDGTLLNNFSGRTFAVTSVALSPDRSLIAVGSDDNKVHLWRSDGTELRVLSGHTEGVTGVAWSPDGKLLVSSSQDGTLRVWNTEGQVQRVLTGHGGKVQSVSWSSTDLIASASWDKTVRIWRTDGTLVTTLAGHTAEVWAVTWSPTGQLIATGSVDRTVRLWSADGTPLATLSGHTDSVSSLAWSPEGGILASGSFDKTARLWNTAGQSLGVITGHTNAVTSVAWGLETGQLATGSWDDTARLWRVRR